MMRVTRRDWLRYGVGVLGASCAYSVLGKQSAWPFSVSKDAFKVSLLVPWDRAPRLGDTQSARRSVIDPQLLLLLEGRHPLGEAYIALWFTQRLPNSPLVASIDDIEREEQEAANRANAIDPAAGIPVPSDYWNAKTSEWVLSGRTWFERREYRCAMRYITILSPELLLTIKGSCAGGSSRWLGREPRESRFLPLFRKVIESVKIEEHSGSPEVNAE